MFDTVTRLGSSAAGDYEIERSLRFNSSDSAKLSRTFGTNSSDTTKTLSFWMKRGSLGTYQKPFATTTSGYIESYIRINNDDTLQFEDRDSSSGSTDGRLVTNKVFRDTSAWYHIVLTIDTTNGTAGDRVRIYVNGVRETSFSSTTNPASSYAVQFFRSSADNFIGAGDVYFDGYLAEIHFIDGTALDASSFGETNAATGQWVPIEYTGAHGTNGFYLNFSDNSNTTAATLGADSSANSNNWTPTNFSIAASPDNDSVLDTPTNNYCTLDPIDMDGHTTTAASCSNGMLQTTTSDQSGHHNFWATFGLTSGKWYCEGKIIGGSGAGANVQLRIKDHGPLDHDKDVSSWTGSATAPIPYKSYNYLFQYGNLYHGNSTGNLLDYLPDASVGDTFMVAFDLDAGKIWFGRNGTWGNNGSGTGDPAAGTYPAWDNINSATGQAGAVWTIGGADYGTGNVSFNFGQQGFVHTRPTGFNDICTANLPEPSILKPETYFKPLLYTGNATNDRTITGVGFEPDLVWIKDRDTASNGGRHYIFDKLRQSGSESVLGMVFDDNGPDNNMSDNGRFLGIRSDGFEVSGSDVDTNANATKYISYNFKESASAGFDMVTYTGTGSSRTVSHNLGVAPEMMIIKNRSNNENWIVYHSGIASDAHTDYIILNTNGAAGDDTWLNDTAPTSSQWEYSGGGNSYNDNGDNYIAYLFTSVEGYSKVGTYYGNGNNDGTFVYCGFKPKFVMMKQSDGTGNWWLFDTARNPHNLVSIALYVHLNNKEDDYAADVDNPKIDCLSNGFKLRGSYASGFNGSDERHIFLAFAERPFKYANAR